MKKSLILFILLSISTYSLYSQNKTFKGRVITESFETMPGVLIIINDTVEVGKTDLKGFYQIDIPTATKKISFWSLGLDLVTIEVLDKCDELEIVMLLSGTYDFITLKKVDRLRMRKFKKLDKLHKTAFEKGIFKTVIPCYNQVFIPHYIKNSAIKSLR